MDERTTSWIEGCGNGLVTSYLYNMPAEKEPEGSFVGTQKPVLKATYLVQFPQSYTERGGFGDFFYDICHRSLHVPHQQWRIGGKVKADFVSCSSLSVPRGWGLFL